MDATGAFEGFHDPKTFLTLKQFYVGDLEESEIQESTGIWN
jgi:cytochrome b involved in lipid metabolism